MKKLAALLVTILAVSSAAHAETQTCRATGESNWREANIDYLQNSAQVLKHVKATGIYLVADLLCSIDTCVGFVNGVKAEATLEKSSGKIEKLVIRGDNVIPTTEFVCE